MTGGSVACWGPLLGPTLSRNRRAYGPWRRASKRASPKMGATKHFQKHRRGVLLEPESIHHRACGRVLSVRNSDIIGRAGGVCRPSCLQPRPFFQVAWGASRFLLVLFFIFPSKRSGGPDGPGLLAAACRAWYFLNPELVGRTRGSLSSEPRPPRSYVVPA